MIPKVKFYCLMACGLPLSEETRDVLLENAKEMAYEGKREWRIKNTLCDGWIKSNFTEIEYFGMCVIEFKSYIHTPIGSSDVTFLIRVDELKDYTHSVWFDSTAASPPPGLMKVVKEKFFQMLKESGGVPPKEFEITDEEVQKTEEYTPPFSEN